MSKAQTVNTVLLAVPAPGKPVTDVTPQPPVARPVGPQPIPIFDPSQDPSRNVITRISRVSSVETVIVAANSQYPVQVWGDRFTIISANLPVDIQPQPGGRTVTYYPGMSFRVASPGEGQPRAPFKQLTVINTSRTTQLVMKIWIGFEDLENYATPLIPAVATESFVTIASSGVAQPLSVVDQYFQTAFFYAYNAAPSGGSTSNNGANVYLGKTKAYQPDVLPAGGYTAYTAPAGKWYNLANCYVVGTAGDGVFIDAT